MAATYPPQIVNVEEVEQIARAERVWLFLDYDGTLADFAPTPDHILPDPELIDLLARLSENPALRVSIISGRRLSHIRRLLPLPGILLAGTYGVELQTMEGRQIYQVDLEEIRPVLEKIKPHWQALIEGRQGFYLEDKGWSLALHARFAAEEDAEQVLDKASALLQDGPTLQSFQILGGHKFLEICPRSANKGRTVEFQLEKFDWPGALPVYIGDDDKDEVAYGVIQSHAGIAIRVGASPRETIADYRLPSTQAVRRWLSELDEYTRRMNR